MKKVLLLTTGGTIACTDSKDGYIPTLQGEELLKYVPQTQKMAKITSMSILNVDSSNMQPEDWVTIADAIHANIDSYDAVIVLHGTDTMAYSASAVSFMTLGLQKPVIFTGAQVPISVEGSDGRQNLYDALCVACNSGLIGVFVVFGGKIMNGCCVSKCDTTDIHAFQSVNSKDIGVIKNGTITVFNLPKERHSDYQWQKTIDTRVLLWKLTPGVSPDFLSREIEENYKIVILEAFGVGGLPMLRNSFLPKITQWREKEILTVVTTQCYYGGCDMTIYETGRMALNLGAICAGNMTREALFTKLMWILSITSNLEKITDMLRCDCCGEFGL